MDEKNNMARENAKKFTDLLNSDEELQKKMKAEFTLEDMKELAKASGDDELSEDEAAEAAGGFFHFVGKDPRKPYEDLCPHGSVLA